LWLALYQNNFLKRQRYYLIEPIDPSLSASLTSIFSSDLKLISSGGSSKCPEVIVAEGAKPIL